MHGVDRGEVDDRPAVSLLSHAGCRRAAAEERTADVHVDDAPELGRLEVLEQEVGEDAGVVHEHVEPAEVGHGGPDQARDVRLPGDVPVDRCDVPPGARESPAGRVEPVGPPVGEDNRRSRLGEPRGAGEAEALAGAGDERDLAGQVEERRERRQVVHAHTL